MECKSEQCGCAAELGLTWQIVIPENEMEEIARWMHEKNATLDTSKIHLAAEVLLPSPSTRGSPTGMWTMLEVHLSEGWGTTSANWKLTDELRSTVNYDGLPDSGRIAQVQVSASYCCPLY